ncbi:MAG: hypothetical protein KME59_23010 [Trichormus sp. ATA11-4-KO1]|jgi:hypothetical protein|nr:hypothetical protein [Trichormus sp. ATA11-4-KO1]
MSKFYNNVKVRLNRKGIKGIPKTEYLAAAEHFGINDLNNVTSEQIIAGVDYLMNKSSTELATVPANDLGITQVEVVEQPEETEHSAATSEAITLDDEEDLEDLAHETTEPQRQQSIEKADLPTFTYEEDSEATALAFLEKSELVASTAHNMGIVLDTQADFSR